MENRDSFTSRLGFIFVAAGCAIGLGNVWRFPYITAQYGGGSFVLIYLFFVLTLGFPILLAEFSVGRCSRKGIALSFDILEKPSSKWHYAKYPLIVGNYLLMMFYTTISGWMIYYFFRIATVGDLLMMSPKQVGLEYEAMLSNGPLVVLWMVIATLLGLGIVSLGLHRGVEKITTPMIFILFVILIVLVIRTVTLPGAEEGLKFYLLPDIQQLKKAGFSSAIFAALGQSFFTLSIGLGGMSILGSYIDKKNSLPKESMLICVLDTLVAIFAGLIIIPACFAFGINPDAGPSLIFVTLPSVFAQMPAGRFFCAAFFLFMFFTVHSSLIAMFENIVAYWIDLKGYKRTSVVIWNFFVIILLSLPCALGFNLLSDFQPFGVGSNVLDLEDFIVSDTILPIGSLVFILFCNHRYGWGQKKFFAEINTGKGFHLPVNSFVRIYFRWILPLVVIFILVMGYLQKFAPNFYNKFL